MLDGGAGNDRIDGGPGPAVLNGGKGNDRVIGGEGVDTLLGDEGNDRVQGGAGPDVVVGGGGNDRLVGGSGNDILDAKEGDRDGGERDVLKCGSGRDEAYVDRDGKDKADRACEDVRDRRPEAAAAWTLPEPARSEPVPGRLQP